MTKMLSILIISSMSALVEPSHRELTVSQVMRKVFLTTLDEAT
jgi:hypothetical protein